jgi:hypothetical protein
MIGILNNNNKKKKIRRRKRNRRRYRRSEKRRIKSMTVQFFVGPWPLFQLLNPIHSR